MLRLRNFFGSETTEVRKLIGQGDASRDSRSWSQAAQFYKLALEKQPELAHIWVQLGHALKESGRRTEAEGAYKRSLEMADEADTYLHLGHLYKLLNRRRDSVASYLRALEREPDMIDARNELLRMGWSRGSLERRLTSKDNELVELDGIHVSFELSDLVDFLQANRYPTGIQRVQLELAAALASRYREAGLQFVYYDHGRYAFVPVGREQIDRIVDLVENTSLSEGHRVELASQLKSEILSGPDYEFPPQSTLINVGTSWGYWNYFLSIREAKRRYRIRYMPFVHDCIPLIFPEFCDKRLIKDFINWLTGMLPLADFLFANSENTLRDVEKFASKLEAPMPEGVVLHLNGEFSKSASSMDSHEDRKALDLLRAHRLDAEEFVLFVSTIEPRKNHSLVLNAWTRMIKRSDGRRIPRLVCVGNTGWMNESFYQRISGDEKLKERVVVLHNVSDQLLRLLYRRCAFTLFPSLYEGWGLPISEALAYHKVPLVSRVASHPEAGGDFAEYFDLDSEADFQTKLDKLIYDRKFREKREEEIAAGRPLRRWEEISVDMLDAVRRLISPNEKPRPLPSPNIACGRLYSFARNDEAQIANIRHSGDIYRDGTDWHAPEPWGCWVRGRSGDLVVNLAEEQGVDFQIFVRLVGTNSLDNSVTLSIPEADWATTLPLKASEAVWVKIPISFSTENQTREVRIRISGEAVADFAEETGGSDVRISAFGISSIYVCATSNLLQRQEIAEAIALNVTDDISRRFLRKASL